MLNQIINYIGDISLRHKAVKSYKYQRREMINQQNNNAYIQVVAEDNAFFQNIITQNLFTVTLNIDVLAFPKDDTEILSLQNDCFTVANEIVAYIEQDDTFMGQLSIHDYDYLLLSHFTDDSSCGVRMSLELVIPNPINLCEYMDNFNEEIPTVEEKTLDLTSAEKSASTEDKKTLTLKPLKMKTKIKK